MDVYTAIGGAIGALYGPLHGGANEAVLRMLERIGNAENIPKFLDGVKNKKEKLSTDLGACNQCTKEQESITGL